jgi:hypothetical protein
MAPDGSRSETRLGLKTGLGARLYLKISSYQGLVIGSGAHSLAAELAPWT